MKPEITTAEAPVSKAKDEVIKEAARLEETALSSAKGHFAAAEDWGRFHMWLGLPMVGFSAVAGASALSSYPTEAGVLSIFVAVLSSLMTFLNPNEKRNTHLGCGNSYDALQTKIRIFRTIDCWQEESEQVLTNTLKQLADQKDKLNASSPQIPRWAYEKGQKGIKDGEASYQVDQVART